MDTINTALNAAVRDDDITEEFVVILGCWDCVVVFDLAPAVAHQG